VKYRESQIDKQLSNWFVNDFSRQLLRNITLKSGAFRGLNALDINFTYPISAIAGRNGSGKSTILALACCAYHNVPGGFKLAKRRTSYYTMSDFFFQHSGEIAPDGVDIHYNFAVDTITAFDPVLKKFVPKPQIGYQRRWKSKGGKWNDYDLRLGKTVVFLGIERIVPHSERSQSKSYSKVFTDKSPKGWEAKVMEAVGLILGRTYSSFKYLEHSKYNLPIVQVGPNMYSGFNMGAGENALFEIFSAIYGCGEGSLLVLDEIELGLHAEAQRKFIERLKLACLETHTQIICTTHSKEIFDALPNDARFYVESVNGKSRTTSSISSEFAFSKMGVKGLKEAIVLVEDDVARTILQFALPVSVRSRIDIKVVGSASALSRQLAAIHVRGEGVPIIAIFDGDQRDKETTNLKHARSMAEKATPEFDAWFRKHIHYLPGDTWPEAWIIQKSLDSVSALSLYLGIEEDELTQKLETAMQAGKHSEFFELAIQLGIDKQDCRLQLAMHTRNTFPDEYASLISFISQTLDANS
jgi:predicted ATPase